VSKVLVFTSVTKDVGKRQLVNNLAYALVSYSRKVAVLTLDHHREESREQLEQASIKTFDRPDVLPFEQFDFILVNSQPGFFPHNLSGYNFLVLTPLIDVISASRIFMDSLGVNLIIQIVVNMIGQHKEMEVYEYKIESLMGAPVAYEIPYDRVVSRAEVKRQLAVKVYPWSAFSQTLLKMAALVSDFKYLPPPDYMTQKFFKDLPVSFSRLVFKRW